MIPYEHAQFHYKHVQLLYQYGLIEIYVEIVEMTDPKNFYVYLSHISFEWGKDEMKVYFHHLGD